VTVKFQLLLSGIGFTSTALAITAFAALTMATAPASSTPCGGHFNDPLPGPGPGSLFHGI
jgi:hypothetical protein